MYSHFDLNVTNASFEWDEHKERYKNGEDEF